MKFFVYNGIYYNRDLVAKIWAQTDGVNTHTVYIRIDSTNQLLETYTTRSAADAEVERILNDLL